MNLLTVFTFVCLVVYVRCLTESTVTDADSTVTDTASTVTCTTSTVTDPASTATNPDPCTSHTCENGGTCQSKDNKAECVCVAPYSGNNCETGPCTSNPCKNGGHCSVDGQNAKCECVDPYSGDFCETGPCTSNPCKNGGQCSVDGQKAKCECVDPYSGDFCETVPCDPNPCKNGGTCVAAGTSAKCMCEIGYEGETCEIDSGPCIPNPCNNHGSCAVVKGKQICRCGTGYTGEKCEIAPTTCSPNPCRFGGTCAVAEEKVTCTCINGYTGEMCEIDPDVCSPNPCKHYGHCFAISGAAYCMCVPTTTGKRCEIEICIDETNCVNEATCQGEEGKKFCICQSGTYGGRCEYIQDCEEGGKYENCNGAYGKCIFENGIAVCNCTDDTKLDESEGYCKRPCADDSHCRNEAKCEGGNDGVKFCDCKNGTWGHKCQFITDCEDDGKYEECIDEYGVCTFVNGNAVCNCTEDKKLDESEGYCKKPCNSDGDCKNEATCGGEENGAKFCVCKPGTADDLCDFIIECDKGEKYESCRGDDGECTFVNGTAVCKCSDDKTIDETLGHCNFKDCVPNPCEDGAECNFYKETNSIDCKCKNKNKYYDFSTKTCRDTCIDENDCRNDAICQGEEGKQFCACQLGTSGNRCETIKACEKGGEYENCTGDKACTFEKGAAVCKCIDGDKQTDNSTRQCRKPCDAETDCKNEAMCEGEKVKFCACKFGTRGDTCEVVTDCEDGEKYQHCKDDRGTCTFANEIAVCNCTDDKKLDEDKGYCNFKFCVPNPCKSGSSCTIDKETNSGFCKCTDEFKYYDYSTDKCTEYDKCFINKPTCGENMECVKGVCKCIDAFKLVNKTCKPNICSSNPCFKGATCSDTDGKLKCSCEKGYYFDGNKCADGSCFLGDAFKSNCTECPKNMKRNATVCDPNKDFELCTDDCGYGNCIKKKDENNTCSCISSISENREKKPDGKCILKSQVCASLKLVEDDLDKCNCDGNRYKQASNGITCELITCSDEIAQNDCKQKGAQCVMDGKKGYVCDCPTGFTRDNNTQMCSDPCSHEDAMNECLKKDQFCYNSISTLNGLTMDCRCSPTLKKTVGEDKKIKCAELAENVYAVTGIPVIRTKYVMEGRINHILLNADLIESMKSTFKHFDYGYLQEYHQLNNDVLNVSVWIQFNSSKSNSEVNRIPLQARSLVCEGCDTNLSLWPPHLLLDNKLLDGVSSEKLEFCSEISKNNLCGKEAVCNNSKCSCPPGFDTVYNSIRDIEKQFRIERCEDVDECVLGIHSCTENTTCVNLPGDYHCQCKPNFKKEKDPVHSRVIEDKSNCYDLCTPNPCNKGTCVLQEDKSFDCKCPAGSEGSFCDSTDSYLERAKKDARIVGGVLGAILCLTFIGVFLLYWRMKKNSNSEEFSAPAGRPHIQETPLDDMGRSVGGVINRSYE